MAGRRFVYLTILAIACVFYIAYGQWLSWIVLLCVAALPWLSLLVSLLPMLTFWVCPTGEEIMEMGEPAQLLLLGSCPYPMPPFRGRLAVRQCFTGKPLEDPDSLTAHCGGYIVTAERVRICDFLGLFALPVWKKENKTILVRPRPQPVETAGDFASPIVRRWRVKPGGGYGENHEHRLYRPGDSLNQVHWKLTAKTGNLILREPMEPQKERRLLTLNLRGTPEELDRKLGRLLWLGRFLLERELPFSIRVLTGEGALQFAVAEPGELLRAVDALLCQRLSAEGDIRELEDPARWRFHIGGEPDEA